MKTDQVWRRGDSYPADWPQWLRNADIEWCRVEIDGDSPDVWRDGHVIWRDGSWRGGVVIWHDGIWRGGIWRNGVWHDGQWHDGVWFDGRWYGGEWRGGVWCDGIRWYDGGGPPVPLGEKPAR